MTLHEYFSTIQETGQIDRKLESQNLKMNVEYLKINYTENGLNHCKIEKYVQFL